MGESICPKCGFEQDEAEECGKCGLIFARYRVPVEDHEEKGAPAPSVVWPFFRIARWIALAMSCVALVLVLRQAPAPVTRVDPDGARTMQEKIIESHAAMASGRAHSLKLEESEVNAWLGESLQFKPPPRLGESGEANSSGEGSESNVRDVKVTLVDDRVTAYLVFGFYGKDLSLSLEGRLLNEEGYLRLVPIRGKLGSLPIPTAALESAVSRVFNAPENREKFRLPDHVEDLRIEGGQIVVSYRER